MLFPIKKFDETIREMKSFGEFLIPYNYPKTISSDEDEINFIKARETVVDGYNVVIYYSKADWDSHYLEIVQITGRYVPFLPFSLVCKIGKKFLGDKYLSYVDFIRDNRKVYCWTMVLDKDNTAIVGPYKTDVLDCNYEGLAYKCLNSSSVNFY